MSRCLTCTFNFRKHCPRPHKHQVNRASQPQCNKRLIAVLSQQLPQLSSEVGRAWILQSHWASHLQSCAACPFTLVYHINTGLNFLCVLRTHKKRLCTFHVLSAWEGLSKYGSNQLSELERVLETWIQFCKVLWCHETCHKSIKWFFINTNKTHWDPRRRIAAALFQRLTIWYPRRQDDIPTKCSLKVTSGIGLRHLFLSDGKWQPLHWIMRWW